MIALFSFGAFWGFFSNVGLPVIALGFGIIIIWLLSRGHKE